MLAALLLPLISGAFAGGPLHYNALFASLQPPIIGYKDIRQHLTSQLPVEYAPVGKSAEDQRVSKTKTVRRQQATSDSAACGKPQLIGTGPYRIPRWYFNTNTRKCELFYYSGCCGNSNNYPSPEACQVLCEVDPCTQDLDVGYGTSSLTHYYFDKEGQYCDKFIYQGSGGNMNNFATVERCRLDCPENPNPCFNGQPTMDAMGSAVRCGFSTSFASSCSSQYYCHVGATITTTVCCPIVSNDPCAQPVNEGLGPDALLRYYYNQLTKKCEQFQYRGLKGNQNNFLNMQDCETACFVNPCAISEPYRQGGALVQCSVTRPEICPSDYYCHIGATADTTMCCRNQGDPCTLSVQEGEGNSFLNRFYYAAQTRSCLPFTYRGLKGNSNNFVNEQTCKRTCPVFINPCANGEPAKMGDVMMQCSSSQMNCPSSYFCHIGASAESTVCCPSGGEPCAQPLQPGVGTASLDRWYFNAQTRKCLQFTYRGMMGNENSFLTKFQCESACPTWINPCPIGSTVKTGPSEQPVQCSYGDNTCGAGYYCHLGSKPETQVCCMGSDQPCNQPMVAGEGTEPVQRWYYKSDTRQCQQFQFMGMRANANNFLSKFDCEQSCPTWINPCAQGQPQLDQLNNRPVQCSFGSTQCQQNYFCHLGAVAETTVCCPGDFNQACSSMSTQGTGTASEQRYYYDSASRSCKTFIFRGLKGNQNNFLTLQDCEATCPVWSNPCIQPVSTPTYCSTASPFCPANQWCHIGADKEATVCCPGAVDQICQLPQLVGEGTANLPRFYFDPTRRQCVPFTYRGTKGNQNNFLTEKDCSDRCPVFINPCSGGDPLMDLSGQPQKCSRLSPLDSCPRRFWCHVGKDDDSTVCCPGEGSACVFDAASGTGQESLPRWYFDRTTQVCKQFMYSGYGGNQNNFLSEESCQRACRGFENPCIGQPATTPSGRVIFCSRNNQECPVNFWCHVGARPETTLCCPGATNPCSVPLAPGTGTENLDRFYYNARTMDCIRFVYNGKNGNQNNFLSLQECQGICPAELCTLSIDQGSCSNLVTRYAYNREIGRCVDFRYGGCGGNLNNFATLADCQQTCSSTMFKKLKA